MEGDSYVISDQEFRYLRRYISKDGTIDKDINSRKCSAAAAFKTLKCGDQVSYISSSVAMRGWIV